MKRGRASTVNFSNKTKVTCCYFKITAAHFRQVRIYIQTDSKQLFKIYLFCKKLQVSKIKEKFLIYILQLYYYKSHKKIFK